MQGFKQPTDEREYLRSLAREVAELAALPVMRERRELWKAHNAGKVTMPLVLMESLTFENDFLPELKCTTPFFQEAERQLLRHTLNFRNIGDDKVVDAEFRVRRLLQFKLFDLDLVHHTAKDAAGRELGYAFEHAIGDIECQVHALQPSTWTHEAQRENEHFAMAQELFGDILEVKYENGSINWLLPITARLIQLTGMENMFVSMLESPGKFSELLERITDDLIRYLHFQEDAGLLSLNNGNHYAGSGSYGFTDELPQTDFTGQVRCRDLWGNLNSQATVGVSPDDFMRVFYPRYERLARLFGLVYYGCCEPVHELWDAGLKNLPHLRKVSVSPWCNVEFMGRALAGSGIVLARKISPNFVGVDRFDRAGLRQSVVETLEHAAGCALEFSFRDIYTLCGESERAGRAVAIVREAVAGHW